MMEKERKSRNTNEVKERKKKQDKQTNGATLTDRNGQNKWRGGEACIETDRNTKVVTIMMTNRLKQRRKQK